MTIDFKEADIGILEGRIYKINERIRKTERDGNKTIETLKKRIEEIKRWNKIV